jgi:hypothetical protein
VSHTGKLLRGNIATASVTTLVQSSVDLYRMADGGTSVGQAVKNVTRKAAGVAGGTAGYMAGAAGGAMIGSAIPIPVVGTVMGFAVGLAGSIGGSALAGWGAKTALDGVIKDDAIEMIALLKRVAAIQTEEHALTAKEQEHFYKQLDGFITPKLIRHIYKSKNREATCKDISRKTIDAIVGQRAIVMLPPPDIIAGAIIIDLISAEPSPLEIWADECLENNVSLEDSDSQRPYLE